MFVIYKLFFTNGQKSVHTPTRLLDERISLTMVCFSISRINVLMNQRAKTKVGWPSGRWSDLDTRGSQYEFCVCRVALYIAPGWVAIPGAKIFS